MFAAESHTSRHHIAIAAMACLCVLLGGPSYAAGAESLFIAGATYCEPGVSGPGWAWTDAGHLELDGYAGDAIGADGDLVVTLVGQNSVVESQAPDADISQCGMEVWGDLTLSGTGSLAASGSQCAIHVSRALVVDGCTVDARADGANVTGEAMAGVIAGHGRARRRARRCRGRRVRSGRARLWRVSAGCGPWRWCGRLSAFRRCLVARCDRCRRRCCVHGRVACVRAVCEPADGVFGAGGVVDASGAVAPHVVVETDVATPSTGETDGGEVPGDNADKSPADANPAAGEPTTGPTANPSLKPAATTTKTTTTVTKTTVAKIPKPKAATATTAALPKTGDTNWIVASVALFLLGTVFLAAACRC